MWLVNCFFLFLSKDLTGYVLTEIEKGVAFAIVFIRLQVDFLSHFLVHFPISGLWFFSPAEKETEAVVFFFLYSEKKYDFMKATINTVSRIPGVQTYPISVSSWRHECS